MAVPNLYVEGRDDCFVVINLLKKHGVILNHLNPTDPKHPFIETKCGTSLNPSIEQFLNLIPDRVSFAEKPVGFVVDADPLVGLDSRWQGVRQRLTGVGVECPAVPPLDGFLGASVTYQIPVGVWLMPDNKRDGTLEVFLRDLIDQQDKLIEHAQAAASNAEALDPRFSNSLRPKAILHTWLAWQSEPGCPYGTAIAAEYFRDDSPAALSFVKWFRFLYGL